MVLVTDPSGFIGFHIVDQLTQKGYKVRGAINLKDGTTDDEEQIDKVAMLRKRFSKLDLFEVSILDGNGWMK